MCIRKWKVLLGAVAFGAVFFAGERLYKELVPVASAQEAAADPTAKKTAECLDKATTQLDLNGCTSQELALREAELKEVVQQFDACLASSSDHLSEAEREDFLSLFRAEQASWVEYANQSCHFYSFYSKERGRLFGSMGTLSSLSCKVSVVYMSTAEVYGAPLGAPYKESHTKAPINVYGRHKLGEERAVLHHHGRPTQEGRLHVVALRTWTISMVNHDHAGDIIGLRNYNDPMIALAEKLARAGLSLPLVNPSLRAQFHRAEEVAEVCVKLGEQPPTSPTWGEPFNCVGQATTHGAMRDLCYDAFSSPDDKPPWWAAFVRIAAPGIAFSLGLVARLCHKIPWLGATRFGERLPFLYRSTDIDSSALQKALGDVLWCPEGTQSAEAVAALCEGLQKGGPDGLNFKRYQMY